MLLWFSVRRKLAERLRVVGYDARRQRAETAVPVGLITDDGLCRLFGLVA